MGKRIRAQRKGSSPKYRVSSHRFPGKNRMPKVDNEVAEVIGKSKVLFYDINLEKTVGEKFYITLTSGKRYNLKSRLVLADK